MTSIDTVYYTPEINEYSLIRSYSLPEGLLAAGGYKDTGCKHQPACLTCTFDVCVLDAPENPRKRRDEEIRTRRSKGEKVSSIAKDLGVSIRTVHRVTSCK